MTSRRTWLLGLTLGVCVTLTSVVTTQAQTTGVPRRISYQGQLMQDGQPVTGQHRITINYYNSAGTRLHSEDFPGVAVTNGIFNLSLGSATPFPATMDFNQQYFVSVAIDGSAELASPSPMLSAPYALNAATVNGFSVSPTPQANSILVLNQNGQIDPSLFPSMLRSINGVSGLDSTGNVDIVGANGLTITTDAANHRITINGGTTQNTGISGVTGGTGLTGSGTSGNVTISVAPQGITSELIGNSAVTGRKLDPFIAGEGLYQDQNGNLNVGVDNTTLRIENDRLTLGPIGAGQIDTTVQTRINGTAPSGSFITGVNQNGTINTGAITGDSSLTRMLTGNNIQFGLNPAYSNTFTAQQNFRGINNMGKLMQMDSATFNGPVTFNGPLTFGANAITAGAGSFTTLTSTGATTLATSGANTTIGTSTSINTINGATTLNNGERVVNNRVNYTNVGTEVNAIYATSTAASGNDRATGLVAEAYSNGTNGGRPGANGVLGVAGWTGAMNTTTQAVGVAGTAQAGNGITAIGVSGQANTANALGNTGVLGIAYNSGLYNIGVMGAANASEATIASLAATAPSAGVYAYNPGTGYALYVNGRSNFNNNILTGVATPVAGTDAVNKAYVDTATTTMMLTGDITGRPGSNTINTTSATTGNNLATALNNGSTMINANRIANGLNDQQVNDSLTVNGGSINASPIGATTASTGAFTTLTSSGQTTLATASGNVGIGFNSPASILDIQRADAGDLMARLWNTGAGGAKFRAVSASGAAEQIQFTDAVGYNAAISADNINGLRINVRNTATDVNSEAGLAGATRLRIDPSGNIIFTGDSVSFSGTTLTNVGAPMLATDAATKGYVDSMVNGGMNAGSFSTLNSTGNSAIGSGASGINSFGTGSGATNTIGNSTGRTTVNGQLQVHNTTSTGGGEVNTGYFTSISSGSDRATGLVAEATSSATGQTRPSANAVLGVAKWAGSANVTDNIVGVVGKAEPNSGISAIGVAGQATDANLLPNTGVLGWAASGSSNVGVTGAVNASQGQLQTLVAAGRTAAVYAFNPSSTGTALTADAATNGTAVNVIGGSMRATAAASGTTSNRWSDTYSHTGGSTNLVTINNSLVATGSTIIVTLENNVNSATVPSYQVVNVTNGSFQVQLSGNDLDAGDKIHYSIINH